MASQPTYRGVLRHLLRDVALHGGHLDLRGFNFARGLTAEEVALLRARAQGLVAFRIEPTRWAVLSASNQDWGYSVLQSRDGRLLCNCEAGRNGRLCKHVALVRSRLKRAQQTVQMAPASAVAANGRVNGNGKVNGSGSSNDKPETLSQKARRLGVSELEALHHN